MGTHPPGAHSLVAVSVGEVAGVGSHQFFPMGVPKGPLVPDTSPLSHVVGSDISGTADNHPILDKGQWLLSVLWHPQPGGTGHQAAHHHPHRATRVWGNPKVPTTGSQSKSPPKASSCFGGCPSAQPFLALIFAHGLSVPRLFP